MTREYTIYNIFFRLFFSRLYLFTHNILIVILHTSFIYIGKVLVPNGLMLKLEPLTDEEYKSAPYIFLILYFQLNFNDKIILSSNNPLLYYIHYMLLLLFHLLLNYQVGQYTLHHFELPYQYYL